MRVSQLVLRNFKRFRDLAISDLPSSAKLVLVVGPNGCGKSSVFDALHHWYRINTHFGYNDDQKYYRKAPEDDFDWHSSVRVNFHGNSKPARGCFYFRTAYRNDPDFSTDKFNRPTIPTEYIRVNRLIDNDATVALNYQRLVYDSLNALYDHDNAKKTTEMVRDELIGGIRDSMRRVFGDLVLNNLANPLQEGAFYFQKGTAAAYHYKNLSGGEKAAFDLLLDMHIKRRFYPDALYCIDEIETHLHTRIQGKLLLEILNIVPGESQLWVTTHSLGVIRAAQEIARIHPDAVAVLDFSGRDFDDTQLITPGKINRLAWEKFLSIALDDLSPRVAPRFVILCEGSKVGNRRKDFDSDIYNKIFNDDYPDLVFVSGGSAIQVAAGAPTLQASLTQVLTSAIVRPLLDRDDLSLTEISKLEATGTLVLSKRNLESYLYADDVLTALATKFNKAQVAAKLIAARDEAIAASVKRGNAPDDMKSAAGDGYVAIKQILSLTSCGNTSDAFMRDTLAPLVKPGMPTYETLQADIITKVCA